MKVARIGIADAYGIESYMTKEEAEPKGFALESRARANKQRHAVLYLAEVDEELDEDIKQMLSVKDYISALNLLKKAQVRVLDEYMARSWALIPNPSLDPYYTERREE